MSEKQHNEKLVRTHERRLQLLQRQQAMMGIQTPAHILIEIEDIEEQLKTLRTQLEEDAEAASEDDVASNKDRQAGPAKARPGAEPLVEPEKEIFLSYAWGGESEEIVNQLDKAFQTRGITIVRDKRDLGFKGRIKQFMERIGRGKCVIVVVSEKYLKSENCMYELVQIARNGQFYDRIFPLVLADANIYKPTDRIRYLQYWEAEIQKLDEAMKSVNSANLQGFREDIDSYTEIRHTMAELTNILKDMNTLTPEMHRASDFEELFSAVERKLAE